MLIEVVEGAYSLSLPATTRQLLIATKIGSNWHICPQICTYVKPECNIRDDRSALKRGKKKVLKTLLVIAVGFLPSLFSLWVIRKTRSRSRLPDFSRDVEKGIGSR
ncbi:hypothetical protein IQ276_010800 [Desmonostoc muscorum LEGE 12446]|uniref:hypothetical protein n=1 Tax=Desmonostoc muscorum TaxID=1179 RepID=UPI001F3BDC45|nr:hypothetical protein [Desmonostoc muscorum]MCF2146933.1 hypothetical protein [Desmonostoc muscorum LEGE 12446]